MKIITDLMTPINQWLDTLEQRERYIVLAGTICLAIILFYLIIWEPITSRHEQQQLNYNSQRQLYNWMKNASLEIRSLNSTSGSNTSRFRNQSIASLADRSAITSGVKPFIEKIDQSKKGVKIKLKSANFDSIISWLTDLENKYAIIISKIKVEEAKEKGAVDALITLERSS